MENKFEHLLSPIKIGNVVLRNRMHAAPGRPHFAQGPEPWPTDNIIAHWANKAKAGAAVVTCTGGMALGKPFSVRGRGTASMKGHFLNFDILDSQVQHYVSQLAEAIHFNGARASMMIAPDERFTEFDVNDGVPPTLVEGDGGGAGFVNECGKKITAEKMNEVADMMSEHAVILQDCGFDMVYIHMAYRLMLLGRFLSPRTNTRNDEFGGSLENRMRFPIMVMDRIKKKCGKDFLIECSITGNDPYPEKEWTVEDSIKFAKLAAGHIDMLQLRTNDVDYNHSTGFNTAPVPHLNMIEAVTKSRPGLAIVGINGFHDPELAERAVAEGKVDIVGLNRAWISNPNYGNLVYEGRKEDIVPCIRCNKCHRNSYSEPWTSACSVNPTFGIENRLSMLVKAPARSKKVAVVGGGPAGMKAALVAAERGHKVTIFERSAVLGGQLKITDGVKFKWPLNNLKNYLVFQVNKDPNIKVWLNTEATQEMLREEDYDDILVAVGSRPIIPDIPGAGGKNVLAALDVFGKEDELAKDVVIIGGGEIGVETGIHLAQRGHKITVLEMREDLALDSTPIHYRSMFRNAWESQEGFSSIVNARATGISPKGVKYLGKDGNEHELPAGSVVLAVGMRAKVDEALSLYSPGDKVQLIGDCFKVGNVQTLMRSSFAAASQL